MAVFGIHFLNCIAVFIATIVGQFISALWFSTLFAKPWLKYSNWDMEVFKKKSHKPHGSLFLGSFIEQFITISALAVFFHLFHINTILDALILTGLFWIGFMATVAINEVLWHKEKIEFYLINQGCYIMRNLAMASVYSLIVFKPNFEHVSSSYYGVE